MSQNNFNNTPNSRYFYFPIDQSRNAQLDRELADIFFGFSSYVAVPVDMEFERQNEQGALDILRLLSLVSRSHRSAVAPIGSDQRDASSPAAVPIVSDQRDASSPVAAPIVSDQRDASSPVAAPIVSDQRDASSSGAAPIVSDQRDASSSGAAPIVSDQRDASSPAAAPIGSDQRDASSPAAAPIGSDQRDASSPAAAPFGSDQRDASILSEHQRHNVLYASDELYASDMLRLLSLALRNPRSYYQEPVQSRNILSRLPTSVVQEGAKPDTCNICLGDHETGEELMRLPCFHQFHTGCITRWIETKAVCPSCRHPIASTEA